MAKRPTSGGSSTPARRAAQDQGRQVAKVAARQGREVRATAKEQVEGVRAEIVEQSRTAVAEARSRLESQAQAQVRQAADRLARLGEEARALSEGRPEAAETLVPYLSNATDAVYEAADRIYTVAANIDDGGLAGVLEDVQAFARRRPGAFLLGAAVIGFGLGRAVRASSSNDDESPSPRGRTTP